MPWARSERAKPASAARHLSSTAVSGFFVNFQDGRVATRRQLHAAGLTDESEQPLRPWQTIQGPSDASTMWYAVMRKRERGVFIGTLRIRHGGRRASLERAGWEEVAVEEIGVEGSPTGPGARAGSSERR